MGPDTVTVDWDVELVEQLAFSWRHLRGRLDGLADEEYLWEPVAGCWSVRADADGLGRRSGPGEWLPDEPRGPPGVANVARFSRRRRVSFAPLGAGHDDEVGT